MTHVTKQMMSKVEAGSPANSPLDTMFGVPRPDPGGGTPERPHGPPQLPRWLSVDQVRKMQRCRREAVIDAMHSGELPFEQRGRIRYARLTDVIAWEERRLRQDTQPIRGLVHPDLEEFA